MAGKGTEAEPPRKVRRYDWHQIKRDLIAQQGRWVRIGEQHPRAIYSTVTRGRIAALRDPEWVFEVRTRNTNGLRADVWMMARPRTEEDGDAGCYRR